MIEITIKKDVNVLIQLIGTPDNVSGGTQTYLLIPGRNGQCQVDHEECALPEDEIVKRVLTALKEAVSNS